MDQPEEELVMDITQYVHGQTKLQEKKAGLFRQGVIVLVALAILTSLEFVIATHLQNATVLLFIIGLLKAAPIVQFFMHISSLWSEEEGH